MKQILLRVPFLSRMLLALVMGVAAIALSAFIYNLVPIKQYFPFVGEVLLLAGTWLLYRTDKAYLPTLGLKPTWRNSRYLLLGLFIGMAAVMTTAFLRSLYTGEQWHFNTAFSWQAIGTSLYYMLPTVMVQELMFRGYLFTKTIHF